MSGVVEIPPLCLISDARAMGTGTFLAVLGECAAAGLPAVQIREPGWPPGALRDLIREALDVRRSASGGSCRVIVNRNPELVGELGLDGCHVGGGDPRDVAAARALVGKGPLVGYSAHSPEEIDAAAGEGADYVTYSPIFSPISKTRSLPALGVDALRAACRSSRVPVVALGGILPQHAAELRRAGAAGAALIGGILHAPGPARAVREFLAAWREPAGR